MEIEVLFKSHLSGQAIYFFHMNLTGEVNYGDVYSICGQVTEFC
jgi:hypothetical protein